MTGLVVRPATQKEFGIAIDWAAAEGWNPGRDDLAAFHTTDPDGFLMGFAGGEPVSSISVVRYGDGYGFLGFYIVRPDRRGHGHGWATWQAGMARLTGRTIGLDGVVGQQDNYRKSGFKLAGRNVRYGGMPSVNGSVEEDVRRVSAEDMDQIEAFDRAVFSAPRTAFLRTWVLQTSGIARLALCLRRNGHIAGYGVIRQCREGSKIGPLFSEDASAAGTLFHALVRSAAAQDPVFIDIPEANREAIALAEIAGLKPSFETARMYRGTAPDLPIGRIYGITTFELG